MSEHEIDATKPCFCGRPIRSNRCIKCGGEMLPGKAIAETFTGIPDFPGGEVCTVSAGGTGKLIDCMKCVDCGWSVTK